MKNVLEKLQPINIPELREVLKKLGHYGQHHDYQPYLINAQKDPDGTQEQVEHD